MSDFLSRLAQRAVGGASGLEPVREPVFPADFRGDGPPSVPPPNSAAGTQPGAHDRARTAAPPVTRSQTTDPSACADAAGREGVRPMADQRQTRDARREATQPDPILSPRPANKTGVHPPLRPSRRQPPAVDPQPHQPPASFSPTETQDTATGAAERPPAPPLRRTGPQPLSPASPTLRPAPTSPPEQTPSTPAPVIVRIGRVDVRATVAPAAPAPAQRRPDGPPALGLKEYLERRNGGRR